MGPLYVRIVEMIPRLLNKEMTKIVVTTINVNDMASHYKNGTKNHAQKKNTKEEPINL